MVEDNQLEDLTLRQLRLVAQRYQVARYSRMTKQELLENILLAQTKESRTRTLGAKEEVEKAKYQSGGTTFMELSDLDVELGDLPAGYGESRIVLLPRDPQWAYAYWDVPLEHKQTLRAQGGQQLLLRLYDVTDVFFDGFNAHTLIEYPCDELAREWYIPIPVSDRHFILDIGYKASNGAWLVLARSASVHVPPMYPSNWVDDYFISIPSDLSLENKDFAPYTPPAPSPGAVGIYAQATTNGTNHGLTQPAPAPPVLTHDAVYRYVAQINVPAGSAPEVGLQGLYSESGIGGSGVGFMTQAQQLPLPALSLFSGLFSAEYHSAQYAPSSRERGFWLVADAELIIYGATEPDATVTMGDQTIRLNPDGTFRFHYQFPDGLREVPIMAVAVDGEQTRAVTLRFMRQTPVRHTNTKAELVLAEY